MNASTMTTPDGEDGEGSKEMMIVGMMVMILAAVRLLIVINMMK